MDVACKGKSTVWLEYLSANLCLTQWQSAVNAATVFPPQHVCHILSSACFWNCCKPSSWSDFRSTGCYNNLVLKKWPLSRCLFKSTFVMSPDAQKFLFKRLLKYFSDKVNSYLSQLLISRTSPSNIFWAEEKYCGLLLHVKCQSLIYQQIIGRVESTGMD